MDKYSSRVTLWLAHIIAIDWLWLACIRSYNCSGGGGRKGGRRCSRETSHEPTGSWNLSRSTAGCDRGSGAIARSSACASSVQRRPRNRIRWQRVDPDIVVDAVRRVQLRGRHIFWIRRPRALDLEIDTLRIILRAAREMGTMKRNNLMPQNIAACNYVFRKF